MTNPITPPPELAEQLRHPANTRLDQLTATYQAGADRELDACCEWLERNYNYPKAGNPLRAARRPKPPSLKEQALEALEVIPKLVGFESERDAIRRALEALDD